MPRKYIRKNPELVPVTELQIARAKALIEKGKSKRAAASAIGISESCLRKRLKLNHAATSMGRFKPTFNDEQELEFVNHCKQMDDRYFGLTVNDLRRLAYEYADGNKIVHRFDKSCKMAGRDWVECFLKRHPHLVLRQSTATSLARAIGFNKSQVDRFYKNLKELYEKYKFQPSRIYNVDETGISTVPKKTPKVVTTRGKKIVAKVVSAERGITITAICCMSAIGHYIPPTFIYPRKRPRNDLLDGGPSQSICMVSDSGFVNTELFLNWLHHFKYFTHPSLEDPVLLLLDNHSSHISLQAVDFARQSNIVMLTLPPHGSHKLQPLDRCLYSPLKMKYSIECNKFMSLHPGRGITQYQVARLFNEAYKKVATLGNAESGFKVTGIYPFDDDIFDEVEFAPSLVTDQMPQDKEIEMSSDRFVTVDQTSSNEQSSGNEIQNSQIVGASSQIVGTNNTQDQHVEIGINRDEISLITSRSPSLLENFAVTECGIMETPCEKVNVHHVSVTELSPLPRMTDKRNTRGKIAMKSQVITASPYKQQLEERRLEAERKKINKKALPKLTLDPGTSKSKKHISTGTKIASVYKGRRQPSTASTSKIIEYFCPLCKEKYAEPPTEEWIQCINCKEWWHEECTSYEKGVFTCDLCTDS